MYQPGFNIIVADDCAVLARRQVFEQSQGRGHVKSVKQIYKLAVALQREL